MSNRGFSEDLRKRIVATYDEGHTFRDVAEMFKVGYQTVRRYIKQWEQEGNLAPKPHAGGARKALDAEQRALLRRCQGKWPDKTIPELTALFSRAARKPVSDTTVGRELRAMGFTRKKNSQGKRAAASRRPGRAPSLR